MVALFAAVFSTETTAEVTRAGPAAVLCSERSELTYDNLLARQSVMWAEGYWTAFNIVLADNCMLQRDLIGLQTDRAQVWEELKNLLRPI